MKNLVFLTIITATIFTSCKNDYLTNQKSIQKSNLKKGNSLIANLKFENNANDIDNSLSGIVSGATLTSDRFGNENSAYLFDGLDDYIEIQGGEFGLEEYTYSAWIKCNEFINDSQTIISIGNAGADQTVMLYNKDNNLNYRYFSYVLFNSLPIPQIAHQSNEIINKWHFITVTRTKEELTMFIDGIKVSNITSEGYLPAYSTPINFRIGVRASNFVQYFNGVIDDVKIYYVALDDKEIEKNYKKELKK